MNVPLGAGDGSRASTSLESALIDHVLLTQYADLPDSTVAATRRLILDTLGAVLAGANAEGCAALADLVTGWGGAQQARMLHSGKRAPAHNAALVNSTMARALEIADVHEQGLLHSTVTVFPAALAAAELVGGVTGEELIAAVALGIDVAIRTALAPKLHTEGNRRPMSHTFLCGLLGASLAAGKLLGLSGTELRDTLGIASAMSSGTQQSLTEGTLAVRLQQGMTASLALQCAVFTQIGFNGPQDALEGPAGFYHAFFQGEYNREAILADLGSKYEVERASIKPYPCCKLTHTAIAAALNARSQVQLAPEQIERVVVEVNNHAAYDVVCVPENAADRRKELLDRKADVRARFSVAYLVATALVHGRPITLTDFDESSLSDPAVLDVMDRVETVIDEQQAGAPTFPTPGVVDVYLAGQAEPVQGRAQYAKGHPQLPMDFDEVAAKFLSVTDTVDDPRLRARRDEIIDQIRHLERIQNVVELVDLITGTR